jgi:hypothetical protein
MSHIILFIDMSATTSKETEIIAIAEQYLNEFGWIPIPVRSKPLIDAKTGKEVMSKKAPLGKGWQETSKDKAVENIKYYLKRQKGDINLGILTGKPSGIFVIDIDKKDQGLEAWAKLTEGIELETMSQSTPSGGKHIIFKYDERMDALVGSQKALSIDGHKVGIDFRTTGNQILIAPSQYDGKQYKLDFECSIAEMPDELFNRLVAHLGKAKVVSINNQIFKKDEKNFSNYSNLPIDPARALRYLKTSSYWQQCFQVDHINKDNCVVLTASQPYQCPICNKMHQNNNNHPFIYKTDTGVWFCCRSYSPAVPLHRAMLKPTKNELADITNDHEDDELEANLSKIDYNFIKSNFQRYDKDTEKYCMVNKSGLINYLNQYLVFVQGKKPTIIEKDFTNDTVQFIERKVSDTKITHAPITKFIDEWIFSEDRNCVSAPTWIPYTLHKPKLKSGQFNLFTSFLHKVPKDLKPTPPSEAVQFLLDHIKTVWTSGNEKHFKYIVSWLAHKIQKPQQKIGVQILIKSYSQGAGKGSIYEFLRFHVFGLPFLRSVSNIKAFLSNFNADTETSLICCLEELSDSSKGGIVQHSSVLKDIITRPAKRIEPKGLDARQVPDYEDTIGFTNGDYVARIETSDRRSACFEASNEKIGDHEYFKQFYSYFTHDVGKQFFHYLLTFDISNYNPRDFSSLTGKEVLNNIL